MSAKPKKKRVTARAIASAAPVNLNPPTQADILIVMLDQKNNALMHTRANIVGMVRAGTLPLATARPVLQNIDVEINRSLQVIATLRGKQKIIRFPTPAEIAALRGAVEALGHIVAQGGTTVALLQAVANLIATYP